MFAYTNMSSFEATTTSGYLLIYNYSTSKLMVFTSAGGSAGVTGATSGGIATSNTIETVAVAGDTGTLTSPAVNVSCIYVTAGGSTGPFVVIPSGQVPAAGEVAVNFGTGVLTFNAADAVTSCQAVYQNSGGTFNSHTHTVSASGGGFTEVSNGTNLSSVIANFILMAY